LFIGQIERLSAVRWNQRRIKAQALRPADRFGLCDGTLDRGQDELTGRAVLASGGLMQAAMKVARQVD
jgi:hypothetical protein